MAASLLRTTAGRPQIKKGRIFPPFCFFLPDEKCRFSRLYNYPVPFK
jgi:hypothetical protein